MKKLLGLLGFLAIIAAVVAYFTFFTVHQTQQAMVLEFGNPLYTINSDSDDKEAGLHIKLPWRNVITFDKRILDLDAPTEDVISSDDKYLKVDAFARFFVITARIFGDYRCGRRLFHLLHSAPDATGDGARIW